MNIGFVARRRLTISQLRQAINHFCGGEGQPGRGADFVCRAGSLPQHGLVDVPDLTLSNDDAQHERRGAFADRAKLSQGTSEL
jgi:hypothetical protein